MPSYKKSTKKTDFQIWIISFLVEFELYKFKISFMSFLFAK